MCTGYGGGMFDAVLGKTTVKNAAPVVTGTQTGVENPIDTTEVSKRLKKDREGNKLKLKGKGKGLSPLDLKIM